MFKTLMAAFVCVALVCHSRADASVMTYSFFNITSNSGATNSAAVAAQLRVDVWDPAAANSAAFTNFYAALGLFGPVSPVNVAPASVLFVFRNNVGLASSISEIYFDDGTILAQHGIYNSLSGYTSYTAGANPGNLPAGNTVGFEATTSFSADAVGNPNKGINRSNDLAGLSYTLKSGQNYADTIASLADGRLRIGLHLRAVGTYSESVVNNPPQFFAVPEPGALLVWGIGMAGFALVPFRRRNV